MKNLKIVLFFVVIGIILCLAVVVKAEGIVTYPAFTAGEIKITAAELTSAGFTGVKAMTVTPVTNNFPVSYFTVKETISGADGTQWGKSANVVAVLVRKMPTDWIFNNGATETTNYSGKIQIKGSKSGYYFVVTGPDQAKIAKLLENLEKLY